MERCARTVALAVAVAVALGCVVGCATAQSGENATAYYTEYDRGVTTDLYCYPWMVDKPLEWLYKYRWTSFCGPVGPQRQEACAKCLKVTNVAYPEVEVTVRIVDECSRESMDLDWAAFHLLDVDGKGYQQGHLTVNYEFVDCLDTTIRLYPH